MRKITRYADPLGLVHLVLFFFLIITFSLLQDVLFFKSSLTVILYFFLSTGLLLFSIIALPLTAFLAGARGLPFTALEKGLALLALAEILFGFSIHFLDRRVFPTTSMDGFFILAAGNALLCAIISFFLINNDEVFHRVKILGRVSLPAALAGFLFLSALRVHTSPGAQAREARSDLVLIVLDGLSTKYLPPYNPPEAPHPFQAIADQSVVYTNIRTNYTYTGGFFHTLYSGTRRKHKAAFQRTLFSGRRKEGLPRPDPKDIFYLLQNKGVNTRWLVFHNNGVPDTYNLEYRGLRSALVTRQWVWYPRWLGIDYNVFYLTPYGSRGKPMGYREGALIEWMQKIERRAPHPPPLENNVIDEIELLRKDPRPFFLAVHLPYTAMAETRREPAVWEIEKNDYLPRERLKKVYKKMIKDLDYAYAPDDPLMAEVAKNARNKYRTGVLRGTRSLAEFVDRYHQKGWDRDTVVIITADHGEIFSRGKILYGYHHEEEVARVPFLVLDRKRKGTDGRLGETMDISQTLLDFFQTGKKLSPGARSLFAPQGKTTVTTLTLPSGKRREWFLNVYRPGFRYVFNLYPGNFFAQKEKFLNYFDTEIVERGDSLIRNPDFDLKSILADYGILDDPGLAEELKDRASRGSDSTRIHEGDALP